MNYNHKKVKGLGLCSGGLDSMLAGLVLREQGIQVEWVAFETPFFSSEKARNASRTTGIPLSVQNITDEYLTMLKSPNCGYGKHMNPCLDCHALMFRLAGPDIEYIVNHSECKAFIVETPFVELIDSIKDKLPVPKNAYIYLGDGPVPEGYIGYEDWLANSYPEEPDVMVDAADIWTIMYTSGTTGRPKSVVKTHESYMAQYVLSNTNMGVLPTDKAMLVLPMCHVNSIFYSFPYTLVSAPVFIYNMVSLDPEELLRTIEKYRISGCGWLLSQNSSVPGRGRTRSTYRLRERLAVS